jgi:hypothetical protein
LSAQALNQKSGKGSVVCFPGRIRYLLSLPTMTDLLIHTENRRLFSFLTNGQFQEALDHWYLDDIHICFRIILDDLLNIPAGDLGERLHQLGARDFDIEYKNTGILWISSTVCT